MLGGARIYPKASEDVSAQDEMEKCKYCYPCDIRSVCCLTLMGTSMHFEVLVEVRSRPWGLFQAISLYLVLHRKWRKPAELFVQPSFTQLTQTVFDRGPKPGKSPLGFKNEKFRASLQADERVMLLHITAFPLACWVPLQNQHFAVVREDAWWKAMVQSRWVMCHWAVWSLTRDYDVPSRVATVSWIQICLSFCKCAFRHFMSSSLLVDHKIASCPALAFDYECRDWLNIDLFYMDLCSGKEVNYY